VSENIEKGNTSKDKIMNLKKRRSNVNRWAAGVAFSLVFITLFVSDSWVKPYKYLVAGFWTFAPPVWLFLEYFFLINPILTRLKEGRAEYLDMIKHEQSVVRAMWGSFLVVVIADYKIIDVTKLATMLGQ